MTGYRHLTLPPFWLSILAPRRPRPMSRNRTCRCLPRATRKISAPAGRRFKSALWTSPGKRWNRLMSLWPARAGHKLISLFHRFPGLVHKADLNLLPAGAEILRVALGKQRHVRFLDIGRGRRGANM